MERAGRREISYFRQIRASGPAAPPRARGRDGMLDRARVRARARACDAGGRWPEPVHESHFWRRPPPPPPQWRCKATRGRSRCDNALSKPSHVSSRRRDGPSARVRRRLGARAPDGRRASFWRCDVFSAAACRDAMARILASERASRSAGALPRARGRPGAAPLEEGARRAPDFDSAPGIIALANERGAPLRERAQCMCGMTSSNSYCAVDLAQGSQFRRARLRSAKM